MTCHYTELTHTVKLYSPSTETLMFIKFLSEMIHQICLGTAQPKRLYNLLEKTCRQRKKRFEQARIDVFFSLFYQNQAFLLQSYSHIRLLPFSFFVTSAVSHGALPSTNKSARSPVHPLVFSCLRLLFFSLLLSSPLPTA